MTTKEELRQVFEQAMLQSWQMIDPLRPAGAPGSYARGAYDGAGAALTTVRENFKRLFDALPDAAPPQPEAYLEALRRIYRAASIHDARHIVVHTLGTELLRQSGIVTTKESSNG